MILIIILWLILFFFTFLYFQDSLKCQISEIYLKLLKNAQYQIKYKE